LTRAWCPAVLKHLSGITVADTGRKPLVQLQAKRTQQDTAQRRMDLQAEGEHRLGRIPELGRAFENGRNLEQLAQAVEARKERRNRAQAHPYPVGLSRAGVGVVH